MGRPEQGPLRHRLRVVARRSVPLRRHHSPAPCLGTPASGAITVWVPIAAFAFLFGLSMDYEVLIRSRMRGAYDEHGDTDRAVVEGIARTGRLVTSAALILFLSFVALSTCRRSR